MSKNEPDEIDTKTAEGLMTGNGGPVGGTFRESATEGALAYTASKKVSILTFRPPGRPLAPNLDAIRGEFHEMSLEVGKKFTLEAVSSICENTGTHLLKAVSPKAKAGQNAFRVAYRTSNHAPRIFPSGGAASIPAQKVLYRPLEIEGHSTRTLVDHIVEPDDMSGLVLHGFTEVFGEPLSDALVQGLRQGPKPIETLPCEEFPIIFVPRGAGSESGDLQITPISRIEILRKMSDVRRPFLFPRRGRWSELSISGRMGNISGALGLRDNQVRFQATAPKVSGHDLARIRAYAMGGPFPWFKDDAMKEAVLDFGRVISERKDGYTNAAIMRGLEQRATALVRAVSEKIGEYASEARTLRTDLDASGVTGLNPIKDPPDAKSVLIRMFAKFDQDEALAILSSNIFTAAQNGSAGDPA